jgi:biotin transport system substrate-specific component
VATIASTLAPRRSRVSTVTFRVGCAAAGSILISGLAQISITLPFTPVPITGQTLGVLLTGAAFGPGLGVVTLGLYLASASLGLPVLAPNADGSHDVGLATLGVGAATGGYLWGFVAAAALVGWLSRRGWDRSIRSSIGAMFLGSIVIYGFGVPWLMAALDVPLEEALSLGLYPFVIGDTLKLLTAAGLLPAAWALLHATRMRLADSLHPATREG